MKSEKAKEYLSRTAMSPNSLLAQDEGFVWGNTAVIKAVELAEQEMINQALKAYCFCRCGVASCIMKQVGRDDCKELREFKQKLTDDEND